MTQAVSAESIAQSQAFFSDPSSYGPFSETPDRRTIIGCIEPRDPAGFAHGSYPTAVQTGGGGAGEALDSALAWTVQRDELLPVETALERDSDDRPEVLLGAHYDCAFLGSFRPILREMVMPSDFTRESVERWSRHLDVQEAVKDNLGAVTAAATLQLEHVQDKEHMHHLVEHVDALYPEHPNVHHVRGQSRARVYVTGLHPNVGLNRNAKPADPDAADHIQGYHDSLAAVADRLRGAGTFTKAMRGVRLTSLLLRSAATRTVITGQNLSAFTFLDVMPAAAGSSGLKIVERQFT